tara:strand:+ start:395 stop:520 length:126 start_codon:yes stop_codon:yes gene_type:complete
MEYSEEEIQEWFRLIQELERNGQTNNEVYKTALKAIQQKHH